MLHKPFSRRTSLLYILLFMLSLLVELAVASCEKNFSVIVLRLSVNSFIFFV